MRDNRAESLCGHCADVEAGEWIKEEINTPKDGRERQKAVFREALMSRKEKNLQGEEDVGEMMSIGDTIHLGSPFLISPSRGPRWLVGEIRRDL